MDKKKREEDLKAEKHRNSAGYLYETGRSKPPSRRFKGMEEDDNAMEGGPSKKIKRDATSVDLTASPGFNLLLNKEATLCEAIPMLPLHYLGCKEAIVR
jgi:hypothetical protein